MDPLCWNTIRCLCADMVQKANSGHPGAPMGMAPSAHILFSRFLKVHGADPKWPGRDRFVLSNGHACSLQYAMLHLTGFPMSMDDLKSFRQLDSKCPGHPENTETAGIEVTTGPLGQGIANAVGLAIAECNMAATFNRPGFPIVDNHVFCFCGDGCLQEGISSEAASLAGHLGLSKLIVLYDDNKITIDGSTNLSFTENVPKKFEAMGWQSMIVETGDTDMSPLVEAIERAKQSTGKPTIISIRTTIGFGAPKQGTASVHGSPLGKAGVKASKIALGMDPNRDFNVPVEVYAFYNEVKARNAKKYIAWKQLFQAYSETHPKLAAEFERRLGNRLPAGWTEKLPKYTPESKPEATRKSSQRCLNALAPVLPELIGGSADLTPSNLTMPTGAKDFQINSRDGKYLRFGIREHAMCAIANGIAAYGTGYIPYTASFLNFLTYAFPAIRLSAISQTRQVVIMTHDSIGLGEDGPTHQPIEVMALIRSTPNVVLIRPADGNETVGAYMCAVNRSRGPTVLALSRQELKQLPTSVPGNVRKGAYIAYQSQIDAEPDIILVGTGSEVQECMEAAQLLVKNHEHMCVRVVSMPCAEFFDEQPVSYRREVLPLHVPIVSVEAACTWGWDKYSHFHIGIERFGASAPANVLKHYFGFTAKKIAKTALDCMRSYRKEKHEPALQAQRYFVAVKSRL